jgi:transcriptional regulator with XRE-family HTH domain
MTDKTYTTIAANIRRHLGDMSYSEWARRADDHPMTISRVVRGESAPGVQVLLKIAEGLGCTLADLLKGVEKPPRKRRRKKS